MTLTQASMPEVSKSSMEAKERRNLYEHIGNAQALSA